MRRLRICQMITSLRIGGAERIVVELASRIDRSRFDVEVATVHAGGGFEAALTAADVPVTIFEARGRRAPVEFARMVAFLRGRFDVVHAHPGTVARYAAMTARVPATVSTLHNLYGWKSRLWRSSDAVLNRFTDRIVAVSDAVKDSAVDVYGLPPDRIRTIYNGIDTDRFAPAGADERRATRDRLRLDAERSWVAAACHLVPHKRPDDLVRALARLNRNGRKVGLALSGDGPMRAGLEELAQKEGLGPDALSFLGVHGEMPAVLAACDAFAHAAEREGLCLAVLEAMSTGLPVIAARAAALENFIDHQNNGVFVPIGDPNGMADALDRILADSAAAQALGAAARRTVLDRFSVDRMVREYEEVYDSLDL